MYAARRKIHFTSVAKNAVSTMCAIKKCPGRKKKRRIITTHSVRCDTAGSGIIFSVMDSTEVPIGEGGRGGCFRGKRLPISFSQLPVFGIYCSRYIALMVLPVDLFHFGELGGGCIRRSGFFRQVCLWIYSASGTLPGGYILRFSLSGVYSRVFIPLWAVWRWMPQSARRSESRQSSRRRCISGRRPGQSSRYRSDQRQ